MTHTGRLITPCNENTPTPAPQICYGQYLKKRVREYVDSNVNVTHKKNARLYIGTIYRK